MLTKHEVHLTLRRPDPHFSTTGPIDGPVFGWDEWRMVAVVDAPGSIRTIGTAHAAGWVQYSEGQAALFRLVIGKAELPGRWLCIGQEFVQLPKAAEEL
jgi:hypothetical protein